MGNTFYKNKNFTEALKYYDIAIEFVPDEMIYHSNKAAVYFEM